MGKSKPRKRGSRIVVCSVCGLRMPAFKIGKHFYTSHGTRRD